jgi:uncharacterized membrane protein
MLKHLIAKIKPSLKFFLAFALIGSLVFANAQDALAARSGGRIGGGSFRAPSRSAPAPGGGYSGGGYGYGGGGFGFPFLLPFFGFGGMGSLFTILIFIAIANFLVRSLSGAAGGGGSALGYNNPTVSVAKVQVGLLANARDLQNELNDIAATADTGSAEGRSMVLQEATLALLRHPEYWVYGATASQQSSLESAEAKFNQLALAERSKFTEETLSNVNSQIRKALGGSTDGELVKRSVQDNGEYIIVTILVGVEGKLELPPINGSDDLQQALRQIGSMGSDRLLAVEVLWTPQAEGDVLTTDDILAGYPDLKLV